MYSKCFFDPWFPTCELKVSRIFSLPRLFVDSFFRFRKASENISGEETRIAFPQTIPVAHLTFLFQRWCKEKWGKKARGKPKETKRLWSRSGHAPTAKAATPAPQRPPEKALASRACALFHYEAFRTVTAISSSAAPSSLAGETDRLVGRLATPTRLHRASHFSHAFIKRISFGMIASLPRPSAPTYAMPFSRPYVYSTSSFSA